MNYIFKIGFLLLSIRSFGQFNYVQNWNFETLNGNPNCTSIGVMDDGCTIYGGSNPNSFQITMEGLWNYLPPWICPQQTPGFKNRCSAGSSDILCTGGIGGSFCARFVGSEYVSQPLVQSLVTGNMYYVEFYCQSGNFTTGANKVDPGMRFMSSRPRQSQSGSSSVNKRLDRGNGTPHVFLPELNPINQDDWVKVQGYVIADNNYSWINFGHFNPKKKKFENYTNYSTIKFDNVKIIDLGPSDGQGFCVPIKYIQNISYSEIGEIVYKSQDLTIAGVSVDNSQPQGIVDVTTTGTVTLNSANEIGMLNGFNAQTGAEFKAFITPCTGQCPNLSLSAGENIDICGSMNPTQIGSTPIPSYSYSWTLSAETQSFHPNALSYLSSTSISNPIFTPPNISTPISVTYYLTVTDICGNTGSDPITINYDPLPNPNPFVNYITFNSSYNYFSFVLGFSSHTEIVYIDIYQYGNVIESYELEAGEDFAAGQNGLVFSNSNIREVCGDYGVLVRTKNFCSDNLSTPIFNGFINVPQNLNPTVNYVSNIFTPNNDNVNDCFGASTNDIASCSVKIYAGQWLTLLHQANVSMANGFNCLWNGYCTEGTPNCACNCLVSDGVYGYILDFKDCGGAVVSSSQGYLTKLGSPGLRPSNNSDFNSDTTIVPWTELDFNGYSNDNAISQMFVYPNPNNGIFNVNFSNSSSLPQNFEIVNAFGEIVYLHNSVVKMTNKIDLSALSKGIYFLKTFIDNRNLKAKIIIQ